MTGIPQAAIDAAAQALKDATLLNNAGYIPGDEQQAARVALEAAEEVWPHDPPRRDLASTVTCGTERRISATAPGPGDPGRSRPQPQPQGRAPFGFGPPEVTA